MQTAAYSDHPAQSELKPRQLIAVAAIGALVLLGIGFMPMEWLHSLAHDTRHALGMPCH